MDAGMNPLAAVTELRGSRISVNDGVALFQMNNSATRNAFTADLKADFEDLLARLKADRAIRVLVIAGVKMIATA